MSLRTTINLNKSWTFKGPDGQERPVDLPHTWNNIDGQDGGNDYWRGTCAYKKRFSKPDFTAEERVYLEFRGVNASARVELNGKLVGEHHGGYSTFRWDVTDFLQDENQLTVHVDNSRNDRVYPQKADFTFYGGIYRDVLLVIVNKDHFDLDYWGGSGLKITPAVNGREARVRVETFHGAENARVKVRLLDAAGNPAAQGEGTDLTLAIPGVRLWDGVKDPYLYTCEAVLEVNGADVDQVSSKFGVRTFSVDPKKGFFKWAALSPPRRQPPPGLEGHRQRPHKGAPRRRHGHDPGAGGQHHPAGPLPARPVLLRPVRPVWHGGVG